MSSFLPTPWPVLNEALGGGLALGAISYIYTDAGSVSHLLHDFTRVSVDAPETFVLCTDMDLLKEQRLDGVPIYLQIPQPSEDMDHIGTRIRQEAACLGDIRAAGRTLVAVAASRNNDLFPGSKEWLYRTRTILYFKRLDAGWSVTVKKHRAEQVGDILLCADVS